MNIRTLCLGILQFEDATGYEINKLVADGRFSHFIEASYGSIYPALTKMMQEKLVTCRTETQAGKPSRKVYSITPAGRDQLFEDLESAPKPNRFKSEFLFLGLFSEFISPSHISEAIYRHKAELSSLIEDMQTHQEHCSNPANRFALGYGLAANQAMLDYLQKNKEMLLSASPPETDDQNQNTPADKLGEKSYE